MDVVPSRLAFADDGNELLVQNELRKLVRLPASSRDWATSIAVDGWRADESGTDDISVLAGRVEDKLVYVTMEGMVREVRELGDTIPVIV